MGYKGTIEPKICRAMYVEFTYIYSWYLGKYTIMDPIDGWMFHPLFHLQSVPIGTVALSWFLEGSPNSRLRASRITSYSKS